MADNKELGSDIPRANIVENVKNIVRNTANLSLMRPVSSRVRSRLKELRELSSAKSEVIRVGNTKQAYTQPPEMFIAGLQATIVGGEGIISYSVYKTDKDGNKKLTNHIADVQDGVNADGSTRYRKIISSSSYDFEKQVIERIKQGKAMTTENL